MSQSKRKKEDIKKNNSLRAQRVSAWLKHARITDKVSAYEESPAVSFVLYWIAFEAAFVVARVSDECQMKHFITQAVTADKKTFTKTLAQNREHAVKIMEMRVTHKGFWEKGDLRTHSEWWKNFGEELKDFKSQKASTAEQLCTVFERLRIVRHQIFHGGSSMDKSLGKTQVEHGLKLLAAFIPKFEKAIKDGMKKSPPTNWEQVPFPHVLKDSPPIWKEG